VKGVKKKCLIKEKSESDQRGDRENLLGNETNFRKETRWRRECADKRKGDGPGKNKEHWSSSERKTRPEKGTYL